jgi:GMP synthase (glutamine-hydrolysing)
MMPRVTRVLVVRTGSAPDDVRTAYGDFTDWFAALLAPAEVAVADAPPSGALPQPSGVDGVVVTGSLASVADPEPWMAPLGRWLLRTAESIPVLGVCFGHQLLGAALGGRVERNPRGPEAGTARVILTEAGRADPLFRGVPARLAVQQSHSDHVPALPPGAVLLAGNAHTPVQAFAHGRNVRAVQFHPEFDAARVRALCESERGLLDAARPGLAAAALASIRDTPDAARVLANWRDGLRGP